MKITDKPTIRLSRGRWTVTLNAMRIHDIRQANARGAAAAHWATFYNMTGSAPRR